MSGIIDVDCNVIGSDYKHNYVCNLNYVIMKLYFFTRKRYL